MEDEGSTFRGAEVREARGSLELDKGAPQGRQPRSRLACPLVLQQRAFSLVRGGFVQSVQTGIWKNTLKSSGVAGDKHAGPDRPARVCCPGTVPWVCVEVPHPQLIFHPVKYNTHTHTLRQHSFSGHGSRRVNKRERWGAEDGAWTVVRAVVTSSVLRRVYQAFVVECGSARPGGHFPRPGGSLEWWWRCNLCFSGSPHAPTWLPAAVKCGGTRARRPGPSADLYLAAWRGAGGTQPVFPCPGAGNPAPPVPQVQRTGGPRAEWQVERGPRAPHIPEGRGPRSTPAKALMKLWVGMPCRQGAHLKNANAIGKSE